MAKTHRAHKSHHPQPKGKAMNAPTPKAEPQAHAAPAQPAAPAAAQPPAPAAVSPELAQQIAAITAQTLAAALPATLEAMGIKSAAPRAEEQLRPQDDPEFQEGPPMPRFSVGTRLLQRHHAWLTNRAELTGRSVEDTLEDLVRAAYAADPTKGGTIAVSLPSEMGQTARSAPRVA